MPNARQVRIDRRIPAKIVIEDTADEDIFHSKEYMSITQMRRTKLLRDFPGFVFIYDGGKKMALFTNQKEVVGVIIKNEQIASMMKMMFDVYWNVAKPFKL
jgi:sugar-specific transcriptional regulator TrmB